MPWGLLYPTVACALKSRRVLLFALMKPDAHILLIDDDELSRELLTLLLEGEGYIVAVAKSGEAALKLLTSSPAEIVLADIQMPGLSGSQLAGRLRSVASQATLLAMSGSQPSAESLDGYDGFLLKPFTMHQFALTCEQRDERSPSTGPAGSAQKDLDGDIYRKLAVSMQPAQLAQLYELCLNDAANRISAMRQCSTEGDDNGYRRAAHAIKGGCGMVGAVQLHALAGQMEEKGLSAANHVASLDEFMLASERLRRILIAT
jgi:CheY-like chemotaxis protein